MANFTHLHVHSHYSLLDGLSKIDDLVKTAKKRGFDALALTDHGNMYGAIEFYERCLKEGIKPIIGMEAYVAPGSRFDKNPNDRYNHLVLLALNYTGYRNLMKLSSLAHLEGFYYKPRIDKELLRTYHEGLVASSACMGGEIPWILHKEDNFEKAKKVALEFEEIFGKDNFYLELQDLPAHEGQMELNTKLIKLSEATGIPLIVTRDSHYLNPEDGEAQDILTCIRDGKTIDEPNRQSMQGVDYSLCTETEIASRFKHVPQALENTAKIATRVNLELKLNEWHFPQLDIPAEETADTYLRKLVYQKLPELLEVTPEVRERADYELGVIAKKGYSPYFLTVADYVGYARTHGIMETTRGSGAGSLVSYAMGITTVNPLYFKLPFERFLNPFRPSPPDIDADFADDRRDDMIAYVTQKYGDDKVAQIITFGTMMARGAVRDVGRALGYSYSFCDGVSKMIPMGAQGFNMTIAKALELEPDLKKRYQEDGQVHRLLDLAQKIEGCARHTSIHAAGVVIAPSPLTDFTPVQRETGGERTVTQFEGHSVEAAGILKMDFLGIRNLSILGHAVEIVEKTTGQKIDIYKLSWNDKKTFDMLARGETMSVFQLSGSGMTRYLKELKPTTIFDIMAMVALFRPGPMESIPEYIRRKNDASLIKYLDPRMESYLDKSLGLMVYQDDVLLTAINLAGYNWEEVDKFRKAMGKKIPEEMVRQEEKFRRGCKEIGNLSPSLIDQIWEQIKPFAAYGFNKAHAASYAVVAYQTAYLKANYSIQYMTAVLVAESGDMDKVPAIIHECGKMGIKVLPPSVNESFKNFALTPAPESGLEKLDKDNLPSNKNAVIRFGLNAIKNVGENIADVIYRERKNGGRYKDLKDFLVRVRDKDLNKKSLESLAKCGALDCFGIDRGLLLANTDNLLTFSKQIEEQKNSQQNSLFANTQIDFSSALRLDPAPDASPDEKISWEKELLGLYVSSHPFAPIQKKLAKVLTPINELSNEERNQWVVVGGLVDKAKKKITRSGKAMLFATIADLTDRLELLVFPKVYEATKDLWIEGKALAIIGRTSEEEGDDKLFVEKAYEITEENIAAMISLLAVNNVAKARKQFEPQEEKMPISRLEIILRPTESKEKIEKIKEILKNSSGEIPVFIKAGDKTIKTSYLVNDDKNLIEELSQIISAENIVMM